MSKPGAARWEERMRREGMPAELPNQPSWRTGTLFKNSLRRATVGDPGELPGTQPRTYGGVELPSDREGGHWTVGDRLRHFRCDAEFSPGYNAKLEELYWRGDWAGFPKWHRQLVWEHVESGMTVAEFARARRLPYAHAWRALDEHKQRAGIGGAMGTAGTNGSKEHVAQVSRVDQTRAVRVKVVFAEKLSPMLGLGHVSYAEGDLIMDGRFVRIDYQPEKPHGTHDHVLIPVGPGITIAVLKE